MESVAENVSVIPAIDAAGVVGDVVDFDEAKVYDGAAFGNYSSR